MASKRSSLERSWRRRQDRFPVPRAPDRGRAVRSPTSYSCGRAPAGAAAKPLDGARRSTWKVLRRQDKDGRVAAIRRRLHRQPGRVASDARLARVRPPPRGRPAQQRRRRRAGRLEYFCCSAPAGRGVLEMVAREGPAGPRPRYLRAASIWSGLSGLDLIATRAGG